MLFLGIQDDKGLLIGVWNPASFLTYTPIPVNSKGSFNNASFTLPLNVKITSITSDPKNAVVFATISDTIYMFQNFNVSQSMFTSLQLFSTYKYKYYFRFHEKNRMFPFSMVCVNNNNPLGTLNAVSLDFDEK